MDAQTRTLFSLCRQVLSLQSPAGRRHSVFCLLTSEIRSPSRQFLTVASLGWAGSTRGLGGNASPAVWQLPGFLVHILKTDGLHFGQRPLPGLLIFEGGEEAEVIPVDRNDLVEEQKHSAHWRGKILFLVSKGRPRGNFEVYAQMGPFYQTAHNAGAMAVIDGDSNTETQGMNLTHVDPTDFAGGYYEIPAARMAAEHRE